MDVCLILVTAHSLHENVPALTIGYNKMFRLLRLVAIKCFVIEDWLQSNDPPLTIGYNKTNNEVLLVVTSRVFILDDWIG